MLEFKRTSRLTSAAVKIQAFFRAATVRREYVIIRAAACRLQRVLRGMQGRKVARHLRWNRASLRVQTAFRRHVARRRYQRFRHAVVALQCQFRGLQARRALLAMIGERSAFKLQTWYRMACARRRYRRYRRWVVAMQCGFRMRVAKRQLRELRMAAREIGNLQANNEKLKEELAQLREQLMKKAELDRLEKERQLAEEKAAAAAAVLDELEQWKVKYYDLERTYQVGENRRHVGVVWSGARADVRWAGVVRGRRRRRCGRAWRCGWRCWWPRPSRRTSCWPARRRRPPSTRSSAEGQIASRLPTPCLPSSPHPSLACLAG